MQFLWPWALLSLVPIAAAAYWALRRPMEKIVLVGSLRLWARAIESLGPAAKKSRRFTAAWLLLLAGAVAAGIALSRPTWQTGAPARRVAVAIWPGAELAGLGPETLAETTLPVLRRLSPADRVRLVLPTCLGGASDFVSPDEAVRAIRAIRYLPVPARDLTLPTGGEDVQHLYRFAPATLGLKDGPTTTTIAWDARPGDVTVDAFAVSPIGGQTPPAGPVQVFVAVRNHADERRRGQVLISGDGTESVTLGYDLPPGGRESLIAEPAGRSEYFSAVIVGQAGPGSAAFAVRRRAVVAAVAIIGRSDPLIRRFVQKNPALRLVGETAKADAVIAIGRAAPAGAPSLLIDPPAPPAPWRKGASLADFALRDAGVLADHPILAHVDLSAVAVRRATGWRAPGTPPQKRLVTVGDDALVLAGTNPPRVWLAFDPAVENTNFAMTESFVIFMANVLNYLTSGARPRIAYGYLTPLQAGPRGDWKALMKAGAAEGLPRGGAPGGLPAWPGLYRDSSGAVHAVSLVGLESARTQADPRLLAAEAPLPAPQYPAGGAELWSLFAIAAVLLWLAGWTLRLR